MGAKEVRRSPPQVLEEPKRRQLRNRGDVWMKKNALRSGMPLAPAGEPKKDAEPAAPPRSETLELLSGYLAKIGKGNLLTDRQEVILSQKARAGDQNGKK
jgi:hypothetical protein